MEVRDAVEADATALASLANAPTDVMRNLVHDRTVRVAVVDADAGPHADAGTRVEDADALVDDDGDADGSVDGEDRPEGGGDPLGFVSFDARDHTVHVTQLAGTRDACARLLSEPVRFATTEEMAVELVAGVDDEDVREAAENVGFRNVGDGPQFGGRGTVRYRYG